MIRRIACMIVLVSSIAPIEAVALPDSFRFVVTGDSRGNDTGVNSVRLIELADAITADQPDLVIFTGDLVNNGTVEQLQYWIQIFMVPLRAHGIEVYPIRGNHDADPEAWQTVFSGGYALPDNGPLEEQGMTYSFVHKNALFIGMDLSGPYEINQPWLDDQLAAKNVPHVFVYNHYPAFSVGHADCLAFNTSKRNMFWNSIARAGGRVYFTGHDHFYDHAVARDAHGIPVHQIVAGSAGAPLYDWSGLYAEAPRIQGIAHNKNNGYVVVDVDGYDVRSVFKERVETKAGQVQYVEFASDILTYTAWLPGQGLPLSTVSVFISAFITAVLAVRHLSPCRQ